jgi:hypothetical protein
MAGLDVVQAIDAEVVVARLEVHDDGFVRA